MITITAPGSKGKDGLRGGPPGLKGGDPTSAANSSAQWRAEHTDQIARDVRWQSLQTIGLQAGQAAEASLRAGLSIKGLSLQDSFAPTSVDSYIAQMNAAKRSLAEPSPCSEERPSGEAWKELAQQREARKQAAQDTLAAVQRPVEDFLPKNYAHSCSDAEFNQAHLETYCKDYNYRKWCEDYKENHPDAYKRFCTNGIPLGLSDGEWELAKDVIEGIAMIGGGRSAAKVAARLKAGRKATEMAKAGGRTLGLRAGKEVGKALEKDAAGKTEEGEKR